MNTLEQVVEALKLASIIHGKQIDKAGEPYMNHIIDVMYNCTTLFEDKSDFMSEVLITAALHDTLEDCHPDVLEDQELLIQKSFGPHILENVRILTRGDGETYRDYIDSIKSTVPLMVKIADLRSNLSRNPGILSDSLLTRYMYAYKKLMLFYGEHYE